MKKFKKLDRAALKKVGGAYADMCQMGIKDECAQYGLQCGFYMGHDNAVGEWNALRCM